MKTCAFFSNGHLKSSKLLGKKLTRWLNIRCYLQGNNVKYDLTTYNTAGRKWKGPSPFSFSYLLSRNVSLPFSPQQNNLPHKYIFWKNLLVAAMRVHPTHPHGCAFGIFPGSARTIFDYLPEDQEAINLLNQNRWSGKHQASTEEHQIRFLKNFSRVRWGNYENSDLSDKFKYSEE